MYPWRWFAALRAANQCLYESPLPGHEEGSGEGHLADYKNGAPRRNYSTTGRGYPQPWR